MSIFSPTPTTSGFHDPETLLGRARRDELRKQQRQEETVFNQAPQNLNSYVLNNPDSLLAEFVDSLALFQQDLEKQSSWSPVLPTHIQLAKTALGAVFGSDEPYSIDLPILNESFQFVADIPYQYRQKLKPDELREALPESGDFFKALDKELTLAAAAYIWEERKRDAQYAQVREEYDRIGSTTFGAERFQAGALELGINIIDPTNLAFGSAAGYAVRGAVNVAAKKVGANIIGAAANSFMGRTSLYLVEDLGDFVLAQSSLELSNMYRSQEVGSGRDWLMGAATALTFGVGQRSIGRGLSAVTGREPQPYFNAKEFNLAQGVAMDLSLTKTQKRALIENLRQGSQTAEEFTQLLAMRDRAIERIKAGKGTNIDFETVVDIESELGPVVGHAPTRDADAYAASSARYVDGDGSDIPAEMPPAEKQQVRKVRKQRNNLFRAAAIEDHPALAKLKYMKTLFNREIVIVDSKVMDAEYTRGRVYRDEPGVIYLNSRLFDEGSIEGKTGTFVLGHEFYHTIARSDPEIARQLDEIMEASGLGKRLDEESAADVLGEAFESDKFWKAFSEGRYQKLRQAFVRFWEYLTANKGAFPELDDLHTNLGKKLGVATKKKRLSSKRADDIIPEPFELAKGQPLAEAVKKEVTAKSKQFDDSSFQAKQVEDVLRKADEDMRGEGEFDDSSFAPEDTPYSKALRHVQDELAELKARQDTDILDSFEPDEVDLVAFANKPKDAPDTILDMTSGKRTRLVPPDEVEKIQGRYIGGAINLLKKLTKDGVFLPEAEFRLVMKDLRNEALENNWAVEQLTAMSDLYAPGKMITRDEVLARFQSMYRRDLAALQSEQRALKNIRSKGSLDKIYHWMVGGWSGDLERGIGNNVSRNKLVRAGQRGEILIEALNKEGKYDEFFKSGPNEYAEAVAKELAGIDSGNPKAKPVADVIRTLYEIDGHIKKTHGAITDLRSNRILGTTHNTKALKKAGKQAWVADTMAMVDAEQMNRFLEVNTKAKMEAYLSRTYDELIKEDFTEDPIGRNYDKEFARQLAARKMIIFKDANEYHYDAKYGSGNPGVQILNQIHKAAESEVILESFGPSVSKMRQEIIGDSEGFWANPRKYRKRWLNKIVFDQIIGDLDHPVNKPGASQINNLTKAVNKVTDLGTLELAGVKAPFYDFPTMVNQMAWMGMPIHRATVEIGEKIVEGQKRAGIFGKFKTDAQGLHVMGAAADIRQFAMARQQGMEAIAGDRLLDKAHKEFFRRNMLQRNTKVHQEAIHDVMQQWVGELVYTHSIGGKLPEQALTALARFDISLDDLAKTAKYTTKEKGLTGFRLSPLDIEDKAVRNKLSNFFDESMRTAVLEPDEASVALAKMGLKAGTISGAAVRILGKFRSYEIATYRQSFKRNIKGYGHKKVTDFILNPKSAQNVALMTNMMAFTAQAIMATATSQLLIDLANGKDPRDTITSGSRLRSIIERSGTMPLIETIVGAPMEFYSGQKMRAILGEMGPFVGLADKTGIEVVKMLMGKDYSDYRMVAGLADFIPGKGVPGIDQGIENVFAGVMGDAYSIGLAQSDLWEQILTEVKDL